VTGSVLAVTVIHQNMLPAAEKRTNRTLTPAELAEIAPSLSG
jgi:hypothetical protein